MCPENYLIMAEAGERLAFTDKDKDIDKTKTKARTKTKTKTENYLILAEADERLTFTDACPLKSQPVNRKCHFQVIFQTFDPLPLSEPAKNKQKCYPSGIYKVADITQMVMVM